MFSIRHESCLNSNFGVYSNLGDVASTTEQSKTVSDLSQFRYVMLGIVGGTNYDILLANTIVPIKLFKNLSRLTANFYDGNRLCGFAHYVDNTHVGMWIVGSGIKATLWGIK